MKKTTLVLAIAAVSFLAGCGEEKVEVTTIPKVEVAAPPKVTVGEFMTDNDLMNKWVQLCQSDVDYQGTDNCENLKLAINKQMLADPVMHLPTKKELDEIGDWRTKKTW